VDGTAPAARSGNDSLEQAGRRPPALLTRPRRALTIMVRALTRMARAWIRFRSCWRPRLRCSSGDSSLGLKAAIRASCSASRSSFFDSLSVMVGILRALATITWWPSCFSKRLIQGECVPHSSAMRRRAVPSKYRRKAASVLRTRSRSTTSPSLSTRQTWLKRSPTSIPIGISGLSFVVFLRPASLLILLIGWFPFAPSSALRTD